jgi:hypothetical protein
MQRLNNKVSMEADQYNAITEQQNQVCCTRSERANPGRISSHVEAESNTSTVALQGVGGDKKGSLDPRQ